MSAADGGLRLAVLKGMAILLPLAFLVPFLYFVGGPMNAYVRSPVGMIATLGVLALAVSSFANAVFAAVRRLQAALVQKNRETAALLAVGRQVARSLDLDEVLRSATRSVVEATAADAAEVWLVKEEQQQVVLRQHLSPDADAFLERTVFDIGEGFPGTVAATGKSILVHDLARENGFLRPKVKSAGYNALGAFPLQSPQGMVGVLLVASYSSEAFTLPEEVRLLEAIGDHLAVALENARLHERVQALVTMAERERIARELHDGMAQVLTYINSKTQAVDLLLESGQASEARRQLQEMATVGRSLYGDVREAILSLRTQAATGKHLLDLLQEYLEEFQNLSGLQVCLEDRGARAHVALLAPTEEIQLLRIVQEALSNVRQHAEAKEARVSFVGEPGRLLVTIADDGCGFDPRRPGRSGWPRFGLQTMEERASAIGGCLSIDSTPGSGTTVRLALPQAERTDQSR